MCRMWLTSPCLHRTRTIHNFTEILNWWHMTYKSRHVFVCMPFFVYEKSLLSRANNTNMPSILYGMAMCSSMYHFTAFSFESESFSCRSSIEIGCWNNFQVQWMPNDDISWQYQFFLFFSFFKRFSTQKEAVYSSHFIFWWLLYMSVLIERIFRLNPSNKRFFFERTSSGFYSS